MGGHPGVALFRGLDARTRNRSVGSCPCLCCEIGACQELHDQFAFTGAGNLESCHVFRAWREHGRVEWKMKLDVALLAWRQA